MRTSARKNLIIFSGEDLLLDVPHSTEDTLWLKPSKKKNRYRQKLTISWIFNEAALQWLWGS